MTTTRNVRKDLCVTHGIKWFEADQLVKEAEAQYGDDEEAAARAAHDMARRGSVASSTASSRSPDSSQHSTEAAATGVAEELTKEAESRFHEC